MKKNILELLAEKDKLISEKTKEILDIFSLNVCTALKSILKTKDTVTIYNILPLALNDKYATIFAVIGNPEILETSRPLNIIAPISILENDDYDEIKMVLTNIIDFLSECDESEEAFNKAYNLFVEDKEGTFFLKPRNDNLVKLKGLEREIITVKM
jgi:hypothetical protein